jgi:hypothetical protein
VGFRDQKELGLEGLLVFSVDPLWCLFIQGHANLAQGMPAYLFSHNWR